MVLPSLKSLKTIFGSPRRRASNGRKHKEKSSESGDSVSETISRDSPAGKTGHQVHPEQPAITIDKVNLMVNVVDWKEDSPPVKETDTDNNAPKFKTVTSPPSPVKARVAPFPRDEQPQSPPPPPPDNHQRLSTASSDAGPEKESCWETDVWEKDICLSDRSSWAASEADDPSSPILRGNENLPVISPQNSQRDGEQEKTDGIKEFLEKRVEELEGLLEEERKNIEAEKQKHALTWLQNELIDKTPLIKENLVKELEREKSLRSEAETRLKEVTVESEQCKVRLTKLQEDFGKLEEMVCGMLQYKAHMDRMQQEKASLSLTYEAKLRKYQSYISNLEKENLMLLNEVKSLEATSKQCDSRERSLSRVLLERLRYLEAENSSLVLETEQQRLQYERCLDDVANQVVQALLAQKSLREECAKLQKQVSDLEQRNRALNLLFQQRLHFASDTVLQMGKSSDSRSSSAEGSYHSLPAYQSPQTPKSKLLLPSVHKHNSNSQTNQSPVTSRISQSEDSTESLASLCSEYSLHSSGSGGILGNNVGIHVPGMPQLSSPPLWLKEHFPPYLCNGSPAASLLGAMQSRGSLMQSQRATIFDSPPGMSNSKNNDKDQSQSWDANGFYDSIWPGLRLRDVEELYGTDELYNYAYDMEQSELLGTVVRNRSKRNCMKNDQNSKNDKGLQHHSLQKRLQQQQKQQDASSEEEDSSRRCTTYSENSPLSNSLSELPDLSVGLDAVETPNDEAPSFDSLPLPVTNQKLNLTGQHRPVGEIQNCNVACQKNPVSELPNYNFSETCEKLESPQRPCSLKLLSPSHRTDKCGSPTPTNGSYSSLKVRRHAACVGNVYTSPSAKPFPNETDVSTLASASQDPRDKDNSCKKELDEKPLDITLEVPSNTTICKQLSSCKETDLVDHKQENKDQVVLVNKLMFQTTCRDRSVTAEESGLDSTGSSPKIRSVSTSSSTHGNLSESPVSADGGGRDEGYSTMSSDVQCDQQCVSGHTNAVTRVETIFSFDNMLSKSGPMQDSGLGLAKSNEEASVDVDEVTNAFENDLEQSLILVKDKKAALETKETESEASENSTIKDNCVDSNVKVEQLDKGTANEMDIKPNLNQKENPVDDTLKPAGSVTSLRSAGSCLSADKLISLCAPQGFKARPPELTFPPPRCIETADKGTVTDLLGSNEAILSDSNLSLSSGDSENQIAGLHEGFEAQGASCDRLNQRSPHSSVASVSEVSETDSFDSLPAYLDSCKAPSRCTELKIVEDQDSDVFYVPFSCKLCPKKKKQRPRLQRLFRPNKLHRSESDSKLEIVKDKLRCPRSVSLDVRKRLSQLPPEQHGSDGNIDKAGSSVGDYQGTSLWRSKAKLSLTEGDEAEEKAVHPSGQVVSWQQQDSLNSLQSLESGETSAHHEAVASKLYSPEGSYISSDSEEVVDGAEGVYSEDWIESADSFQKTSQVKFTSDFGEDTQDWTMEYDQRLVDLSHPDSLPMSGPLPAIQETTCELSEEMWQEGGQARASWCSSVADGSDNFLLNDHLSRSSNETPDETNCTTVVGSSTLEQDYSESIPGSEEGELKPIEVEFKRDFYHLCKVDSRSLNMSNRSLAVSDNGSTERDGALSRRSYSTEPEIVHPTLTEEVSRSTPNDISKSLPKKTEGNTSNTRSKKPVNTIITKCDDSPRHELLKPKENKIQKDTETRTDILPEVETEPIKPSVKLSNEVIVIDTEQKDENLTTNLNHSLEDKVSTKEKLEELSAMMAQSHVAEEEEQAPASQCPNSVAEPGLKEGCTTSWVHIEADVDLTDPKKHLFLHDFKARANLLDSMLASSSSSSSSSECGEETREYQHLHELHRYRRHRRASERENCVLRYIPPTRPSILDRHDFYFRYGEQEQAAVASFDFLEDLSTSASDFGSAETLNVAEQEDNSNNREKNKDNKWFTKPSQEILAIKDCLASQELMNGEKMMMNSELLQAKANSELRGSTTTLDSHDCEAAERLSLSDSCAESFSSSSQSLNAIE